MQALRHHLLGNRTLAALIIAAALLLRAAIPAGYMIAPSAQAKQIFVTVCTGMQGETKQVALPTSSKQAEPGKEHQAKDSPCAFTALAGLADVAQGTDLALAPLATGQDLPPASRSVSIGRGLAAPPPYQTGPPAIA